MKQDNTICICGDFKVTVNPQVDIDSYHLPRIDDIFVRLSGRRHFNVLDLKQAYLQMELEEDSQKYMVVNLPKGRYQYQRLSYGIASAPAIWQQTMNQVLQGTAGVQCYLTDIIITGRTTEEHFPILDSVLRRLQEYGLTVN